MSTTDNLRGMVEAVTTGNLARLGKYVLEENRQRSSITSDYGNPVPDNPSLITEWLFGALRA